MGVLFDEIRQAAATDAPVCISGETGSGKEATARAIHAASNRAQGPFIAINCAALLFGHPRPELAREKPISTESIGLEEAFAATNAGGSLFLDGLEDLNDAAQTRLLSLIDAETRSRTRGGAPAPWEGARLRIISSSAGELETRVQKGEFRSDLFYRLKVLPIQVPSLRERGEDIWILARYFLAQLREQYSIKAAGFSKDALAVLALHDWPGNLHELRSRVHGAALSCKGPYITPTDLDLEKRGPWRHRMTLQQVREEAEHRAIEAAVKRNSMNLTRAAEELGVSRMTLYRMLEKHEIEVER
jgi:DNA-binding NtrC family response regulator